MPGGRCLLLLKGILIYQPIPILKLHLIGDRIFIFQRSSRQFHLNECLISFDSYLSYIKVIEGVGMESLFVIALIRPIVAVGKHIPHESLAVPGNAGCESVFECLSRKITSVYENILCEKEGADEYYDRQSESDPSDEI